MRIILLAVLVLISAATAKTLGVDQQAAEKPAEAPLGSRDNPVLCYDPEGERAYLSRLRAPDGSRIRFERGGSTGAGPCGHILDRYVANVGDEELSIFMDMYHPGYWEDRAVPGFLIASRYSAQLVIGEDGLLRRIGESEPAEGEVIDRDDEGRPVRQMTVKAGCIVGEFRDYHESGQVRVLIEFRKGKEHGRYEEYDEKGNRVKNGQFSDGVSEGVWTEFDARGVKRKEYEVVNGQLHGHERVYNGRGELIKENWYEDGDVVRSEVHKPEDR